MWIEKLFDWNGKKHETLRKQLEEEISKKYEGWYESAEASANKLMNQVRSLNDELFNTKVKLQETEKKLKTSVSRINELLKFETDYQLLAREKAVKVAHLVQDLKGTVIMRVLGKSAMHYTVVPTATDLLRRLCKNLDAIVILRVDDLKKVDGFLENIRPLPENTDDLSEDEILEGEVVSDVKMVTSGGGPR